MTKREFRRIKKTKDEILKQVQDDKEGAQDDRLYGLG